MTSEELSIAVDRARRTVDQLTADRDALRAFDPRVAGRPATFDLAEAEAVYATAIDAARRTLDTFISAAAHAAATRGPAAESTEPPRADDGP